MNINKRKEEHIKMIVENSEIDRKKNYFNKIHLIHRAFPEIDFDEIDISTEFLGKQLSFPLMISSLTGGESNKIIKINRNLAKASEKTGIAMAVGSQRIMMDNKNAEKSFNLRKYAPTIHLISNLGLVQFNYGFGLEECQKAIEVLNADAICFHINPLQEAIQKEGNKNFKGLISKLKEITKKLSVPVIVKEVGCGISVKDAKLIKRAGVQIIDVAGVGGTSFAYVESLRSKNSTGEVFKDFGIPTTKAVYDIAKKDIGVKLIASGGIRNGLDMAKAIILGADLCAIARPFLELALKSERTVIQKINEIKKEFQIAMFVLGKSKVKNLKNQLSLIENLKELKNDGWY